MKVSHFFLRVIGFFFLEPRLRRGRLTGQAHLKLRPAFEDLIGVFHDAEGFFADVNMCRDCAAGCCAGEFSRFSVYDHITHLLAGMTNPPEWKYRLYPFRSYKRNRKDTGWCPCYIAGQGCSFEFSLRPAMCVWWICGKMKGALTAEQMKKVAEFRRRIDKVQWKYARALMFRGIERISV